MDFLKVSSRRCKHGPQGPTETRVLERESVGAVSAGSLLVHAGQASHHTVEFISLHLGSGLEMYLALTDRMQK